MKKIFLVTISILLSCSINLKLKAQVKSDSLNFLSTKSKPDTPSRFKEKAQKSNNWSISINSQGIYIYDDNNKIYRYESLHLLLDTLKFSKENSLIRETKRNVENSDYKKIEQNMNTDNEAKLLTKESGVTLNYDESRTINVDNNQDANKGRDMNNNRDRNRDFKRDIKRDKNRDRGRDKNRDRRKDINESKTKIKLKIQYYK